MMTKQQEREALERIKNILADAGADSYIGMAFAGCVEDAESNIENDWALTGRVRNRSWRRSRLRRTDCGRNVKCCGRSWTGVMHGLRS